jgi:hypothetical protein
MKTETVPEPREIVTGLQTIRAHWSSAKRRERRRLATTKQRQLLRCLATGRTACQGVL